MTETPSPGAVTTAGVIGLGAMGAPMAAHMVRAGFKVFGYDPDAAARRRTADVVEFLPYPSAVARQAELTLVIVPTDDDVTQVCTGKDGLFSADGTSRVVAICSSVRPETIHALERPATRAGFDLLDVPLTKGVRAAEAGTMTLLAGGDAGVLRRVIPVFQCFSAAVHHVGGLGAGQIGKTVNNLLLWSNMVAVAEALTLAAKLGASPEAMCRAMQDCSADSWVLREFGRIVPTWPGKDMQNALAMAEGAGVDLPLMRAVAREVGAYDRRSLERILKGEQPD